MLNQPDNYAGPHAHDGNFTKHNPFARTFFLLDLPPCSIHQSIALGETKKKKQ